MQYSLTHNIEQINYHGDTRNRKCFNIFLVLRQKVHFNKVSGIITVMNFCLLQHINDLVYLPVILPDDLPG